MGLFAAIRLDDACRTHIFASVSPISADLKTRPRLLRGRRCPSSIGLCSSLCTFFIVRLEVEIKGVRSIGGRQSNVSIPWDGDARCTNVCDQIRIATLSNLQRNEANESDKELDARHTSVLESMADRVEDLQADAYHD